MSNTIAIFVVTVTVTAGVSFWIGAVVGYTTGQRTAQHHLRAKIIADVEPCHKLPQLAAIICRLNTIGGPKGLDLPKPPRRETRPVKLRLPDVLPPR